MTSQFTAREYLKIDIAGLYGLDKKTWAERLAWFDAHESELESLADKADSPNCYIAAVNAWRDVHNGEPIGYGINLDATASGCQIMALLTRDKKSAMRVNLVNTDKREDLYSYIFGKMKELVPVADGISREKVKKSIMTSLYGSEAKPREVFGDKNLRVFDKVMTKELPAVWKLNKFLLKHWDSTKEMYSWVLPDNFHVDCKVTNKVTFECQCLGQDLSFTKEIEGCTENGKFLSANLVHSVDGLINREITLRCNFSQSYKDHLKKLTDLNAIFSEPERNTYKQPKDSLRRFKTLWKRYKKSGFLSARILQYVSIDALKLVGVSGIRDLRKLIDSLPNKTFEVYSIHDCYRVLPSYGNQLREQYRIICKQIAESNMLDDIVSSMFDRPIHFKKMNEDLGELVMQSEYAIC